MLAQIKLLPASTSVTFCVRDAKQLAEFIITEHVRKGRLAFHTKAFYRARVQGVRWLRKVQGGCGRSVQVTRLRCSSLLSTGCGRRRGQPRRERVATDEFLMFRYNLQCGRRSEAQQNQPGQKQTRCLVARGL